MNAKFALSALVPLAAMSTACGAAASYPQLVELTQTTPDRYIETVGNIRYEYHLFPLVNLPETASASPFYFASAPPDIHEIGGIKACLRIGFYREGVREIPQQFYPTLSILAARMGGTNFTIAHETDLNGFAVELSCVTATVFAPDSTALLTRAGSPALAVRPSAQDRP